MKITTALFDFDGVVADTEPLYDVFWENVAKKYGLDIPDFPARIKGTSLQNIFAAYFSAFPESVTDGIVRACTEYELKMEFPEIRGAVSFLHLLKERGIRLGLVTSSSPAKIRLALRKMGLEEMFGTVVTPDRIVKGKPDPSGYLLAAEELGALPQECVVFEDSFSGIQAGNAAGMRVIGLATTNPADAIRSRVSDVAADFSRPEEIWEKLMR